MGGVFFRGNQVFLKRVLCFVKWLTSCHVIFQLGYMIYDMTTFTCPLKEKKLYQVLFKRLPRVYLLFFLHNYNALKFGVLQKIPVNTLLTSPRLKLESNNNYPQCITAIR